MAVAKIGSRRGLMPPDDNDSMFARFELAEMRLTFHSFCRMNLGLPHR
jgi:hypothetical protein